MKKILTLLALSLASSPAAFAQNYCGQFAADQTYIDHAEGGAGASITYSLSVANYYDKSEGGPGAVTEKYSFDLNHGTKAERSLRRSALSLLQDGGGYCFTGTARSSTILFETVSADN